MVGTSTFLAIERGPAQWALHAKLVQRVISAQEWSGAPPFDIALALELDIERDGQIILLAAEGATVPLRAFGKLSFRQLDVDLVQPVPAIVRNPGKRQVVSGIVFEGERRPLVVLDPATLLAMAKEAQA
jgi:hypothetical protein